MDEKKVRKGRKPKQETLELRASVQRIEEMLANVPKHIKQEKSADMDSLFESLDSACAEILSDYRGAPSYPHDHIFKMASLGHELLSGYEEGIIKNDADLKEKIDSYRRSGGENYKKDANAKAFELCIKNRILLGRLAPIGPLSLSDVAKKIQNQWNCIPPDSRMPGEEKLERRGIRGTGASGTRIPSTKTIERYIQAASPFIQHRVRQSSRTKK